MRKRARRLRRGPRKKLTSLRKKLIAELEEGGEEYIDKDFGNNITSSQKRKVIDHDPGLDQVPLGEIGDPPRGTTI